MRTGRPRLPLEQRLSRYTIALNGCWEWQGYIDRDGYSKLGTLMAHRVSYEFFKKEPLAHLTVDHLCRNRKCVNPDHLEPVSNVENVMRGMSQAALNAKKTHCMRGHPFNELNTYHLPKGGRACRICSKNSQLAYELRNPNRKRSHAG